MRQARTLKVALATKMSFHSSRCKWHRITSEFFEPSKILMSALFKTFGAMAVSTLCLVFVINPAISAEPSSIDFDTNTQGSWLTTASGCHVWSALPTVSPSAITTWSGNCIDGRASGSGIVEEHVGSIWVRYEGEVRDGKSEGHGKITASDGQILEANWHNGFPVGIVTFSQNSLFHYVGEWSQHHEEGKGIAIWPNGTTYEGDWHLGARTGHGKLTYKSGLSYEGDFVDGRITGHELVRDPNGNTIEGEFIDGNPVDGVFKENNADGSSFIGQVVGRYRTGQGTFQWPSGRRYVGEFSFNKPNGNGVYFFPNGDRYEGEVRDWIPNGDGTLTRADGDVFSGKWNGGCFHEAGRSAALMVEPSSCR